MSSLRLARGAALVGAFAWCVCCAPACDGAASQGDAGADASGGDAGAWVFDDELDGATLDASAWLAVERPGDAASGELQCYRAANVSEAAGSLVLVSQVDAACSPLLYGSGMVQWKTFQMLYGTIQIAARLAGGKGAWPALRLLDASVQATNPSAAPAPGSVDEIDVAEIKSSVHTVVWQNLVAAGGATLSCSPTTSDVSQSSHLYELAWAPGQLTWRIDGAVTCTQTTGVPSKPMFLVVGTAMGGAGGSIDNGNLPQQTAIDYVRVAP